MQVFRKERAFASVLLKEEPVEGVMLAMWDKGSDKAACERSRGPMLFAGVRWQRQNQRARMYIIVDPFFGTKENACLGYLG